jgi:hypothetical protein
VKVVEVVRSTTFLFITLCTSIQLLELRVFKQGRRKTISAGRRRIAPCRDVAHAGRAELRCAAGLRSQAQRVARGCASLGRGPPEATRTPRLRGIRAARSAHATSRGVRTPSCAAPAALPDAVRELPAAVFPLSLPAPSRSSCPFNT